MIPALLFLWLSVLPPPEATEMLGIEPDSKLDIVTLYTRDAPARKEPPLTVRQVDMANCGGNRFLFGVHFMEAYPADNGLLILYVDCDADPRTGREGHGCEFMLIVKNRVSSVTAYGPGGERLQAEVPRAVVHGSSVWVSYDLDFPQENGASLLRLAVLSEKSMPHVGMDHVGYQRYRGPPASKTPKLILPQDYVRSRGFGRVSGLRRMEEILGQDGVVLIAAPDASTIRGFRRDRSEYRRENVTGRGGGGELVCASPVAGRYHLGVVLYDDHGKDVFRVASAGKRLGHVVGNWDDRKQHLFFSEHPLELSVGQPCSFLSVGTGRHRTEAFVFLPTRPAPAGKEWAYRNLALFDGSVCFTTTWPATCRLETRDGQVITEAVRTENHRFRLSKAREGASPEYRITSRNPLGEEITTPWRKLSWPTRPAASPRRSGTVDLKVSPPAGTSLQGWPVSSGVPFPAGELFDEHRVRLRGGGKAVPLQTAILGRWPDGSIKWLLCDFRHQGGQAAYTLEYGPDVRRETKPTPRSRLDLHELELVRGDGKRFIAALRPEPEEGGFLRQCFVQRGHLEADDKEAFFHYEVRAHEFQGLPWMRVLVTVEADETCPEWSEISSITWRLEPFSHSAVVDGKPDGSCIAQYRDDACEGAPSGVRRWDGPIGPVRIRDFWQNYPKAVRRTPRGLLVDLFPPLSRDQYAWAKGTTDEHRLFFWFSDGKYRIRQGMSKTHEIWIGRDGAPPPCDRVLVATCTPRWYARSAAFRGIGVSDPPTEMESLYDKRFADAFEVYLENREKNREYGLFNFGDWWGERGINWGNVEYDTQHAFFLQFARTGDVRYFYAAEEADLHNREIDTTLRHANPARIGTVPAHAIGHVGGYYRTSPVPGKGSPSGYITVSHTWVEGHLDHYFLTGDRRSLFAARTIADHYNTYSLDGYDFTNTRIPGWHLILTLAVYRATQDPFYLNAARIIVERVLERQTLTPFKGRPAGGWVRMMVPGHCHCDPFHYGNAGFMIGVLLSGLERYHELTGDPRVAEAMVRATNFMLDDMWVPDRKGFHYTSCPRSSVGVWSNLGLSNGFSSAHELSKDARIGDVLRQALDASVTTFSGFGKSLGQTTREMPHTLSRLRRVR